MHHRSRIIHNVSPEPKRKHTSTPVREMAHQIAACTAPALSYTLESEAGSSVAG